MTTELERGKSPGELRREREQRITSAIALEIPDRVPISCDLSFFAAKYAGIPLVSITDCPQEIWDQTLDTDLKGVFLCLKYEMRQMIKQGGGLPYGFMPISSRWSLHPSFSARARGGLLA